MVATRRLQATATAAIVTIVASSLQRRRAADVRAAVATAAEPRPRQQRHQRRRDAVGLVPSRAASRASSDPTGALITRESLAAA